MSLTLLGTSAPAVPAAARHLPTDGRMLVGLSLGADGFLPASHFAAISGAGPAVIGVLTVLLGASNGLDDRPGDDGGTAAGRSSISSAVRQFTAPR